MKKDKDHHPTIHSDLPSGQETCILPQRHCHRFSDRIGWIVGYQISKQASTSAMGCPRFRYSAKTVFSLRVLPFLQISTAPTWKKLMYPRAAIQGLERSYDIHDLYLLPIPLKHVDGHNKEEIMSAEKAKMKRLCNHSIVPPSSLSNHGRLRFID